MQKILSALLVVAMLVCMIPAFAVSADENPTIIDIPTAKDDKGNVLKGGSCTGWQKPWIATENELYLSEGEDWDQMIFEYEFTGAGKMEFDFKADQTYKNWDFGALFCVTDADNDRAFVDGQEDWSGYWLITNHLNELCIRKKGSYNGNEDSTDFQWSQYLNEKGISPYEGYHVSIEWNGKGIINVYINNELAYYIDDSINALTGAYCGFRGAAYDQSGVKVSNIRLTPERGEESPAATYNGSPATGYSATEGKPWSNNVSGLKNTQSNSTYVFDNAFKAGTVEATVSKSKGESGIIFGVTGMSTDFWNTNVQYYFLSVENSTGNLLLTKEGDGYGKCLLKSMSIPNWQDCTEVDLKLVTNGNGRIEIWANGEYLCDFCDSNPIGGVRVGLRATSANANFSDIVITTAEPSDESIKGGVELPFIKVGEQNMTGYITGGPWNNSGKSVTVTENSLKTDNNATVFVVENDTLSLSGGSLTATVRAGSANAADNKLIGILFGIEAEKNVSVWMSSAYSPKAYMMYVNENGKLVLGKTGMQNSDDGLLELQVSASAISNYVPNQDNLEIKAEFGMNSDWTFTIKGYVNGELMLEYNDGEPLIGERYGFVAYSAGSELLSMEAEAIEYNEMPAPPSSGTDNDANTNSPTNNPDKDDSEGDSSVVLYIVIAAVAVAAVGAVVVLVTKKKKT